MLKALAEYIVGLKDVKTYEINGETFAERELVRVLPRKCSAKMLQVNSLDALVEMIKNEITIMPRHLFVDVDTARHVRVFSSLDEDREREYLYEAVCDVPGFTEGYRGYETAIVELRSRFLPSDGVDYLLTLLSRVNKEQGVTTMDNGVTQTVEARSGVSLKEMVAVKPRVTLAPYRTFLEVQQPFSEFLLRLDEDGNVGLFEADGGMWKMDAKKLIAQYLTKALEGYIANDYVTVIR